MTTDIARRARTTLLAASLAAGAAAAEPGDLPGYVRHAMQQDCCQRGATLGTALPPAQLAELRGGFTDSNGLRFAFSFDRVTRLNGEALSRVSVVLPVFTLVDGATQPAFTSASQHLGNLSTLSPGTGASALNGGLPMQIQNALDNQHIENLTLINLDIIGTDTLRGAMIRNLIETTSIESLSP
ncbi:hypothetical protein [Parahaliea mediterranea]|uniref:Secreted protein n=1 Tax=Parahaliea mediterranea TaxID=651086 RepID=A0A939DG00_9GAMM|nr:hypothetical protein [Parahaliea mediterranea]MBN7797481.1 hypothetical protein [Parahaliea mediterranea]